MCKAISPETTRTEEFDGARHGIAQGCPNTLSATTIAANRAGETRACFKIASTPTAYASIEAMTPGTKELTWVVR